MLLLHREIWQSANGPVPEGYQIHHKDGDVANNDIGNLQLVTPAEHNRIHKGNEEHRVHLRRIQHLGNAASHISRRLPEKREANRQRMLASHQQQRTTKTCPHCLQLYEGNKKQRFCSQACGVMWRAKQKTKIARAVLKTCPHCGRSFNGRRSDSKYCSQKCQQRALNEREKEKRQIARSVPKECPGCGKSINDRSSQARYCSPRCQQRVRYHSITK